MQRYRRPALTRLPGSPTAATIGTRHAVQPPNMEDSCASDVVDRGGRVVAWRQDADPAAAVAAAPVRPQAQQQQGADRAPAARSWLRWCQAVGGRLREEPAAVTVTYGAIGSGGGIDQITARAVDFGASDAPLTTDQATACKGCVQIPWALGATVVSYNVKGVPEQPEADRPGRWRTSSSGTSRRWNDPKIKALNPGVNLPSTHITPIYRSDGSGDSFVFSSYLSAVSPDFKSKVGASTQPTFPTGTGAAKNSGVVAAIQSTDGAIGYVAISYIAADSLNEALIQNAAGQYPSRASPASRPPRDAVTTAQPDGSIPLVNPPASASGAYPLSTYTYVIVPKSSPKAAALQAFLTYAITRRPGVRARPRLPAAARCGRRVRQDGDRRRSPSREWRRHCDLPPRAGALPPRRAGSTVEHAGRYRHRPPAAGAVPSRGPGAARARRSGALTRRDLLVLIAYKVVDQARRTRSRPSAWASSRRPSGTPSRTSSAPST